MVGLFSSPTEFPELAMISSHWNEAEDIKLVFKHSYEQVCEYR